GAKLVFLENHQKKEPSMNEITTIGLDLAKHVFQVHGVDAQGSPVLRKQLRRGQVLAFFSSTLCGRGGSVRDGALLGSRAGRAWARGADDAGAIREGVHQTQQARRRRAEAICEAVGRPTMRFVPVKTAEQQATQLLHRGREQLVRQRTMLVNALRAHLAELR